VIVGDRASADTLALSSAVMALSLPGAVQQTLDDSARLPASSPLSGKKALNGTATAYVCIGPQCSPPITDPEALLAALRDQRGARKASA
jgi:uncharacterized protein YyaL (SSP411 family)